ncbi:peroxisome assembly protein 10-B-like [Brevipalpus obovatus]|uniref:peroxisome assembly protein 10-B-like n=1 Tax=Brevipalpus obovatus TaxID=246614 RepID=UPI003D9EDE8C
MSNSRLPQPAPKSDPPHVSMIVSSQKDEEYVETLKQEWSFIFQKILGPRKWLAYRKYLELTAPFSYYLLTNLSGYQTLGEEYASLVQYQHNPDGRKTLPTIGRRFLMVILSCVSPFARDLISKKYLRDSEDWEKDTFNFVCQKFEQIHRIIFYYKSTFLDFSKRFSGIRYLSYAQSKEENGQFYRLMGFLSLIEFVLNIIITHSVIKFEREKSKQQSNYQMEDIPSDERCCLCFGKRRETTSTACGHLFCWNCICQWIVVKNFCPICRYGLEGGHKLILLNNY